jgi:ribonuclease HI
MWQILAWVLVGGEYLIASNQNVKGDLFLTDQRGYSHKIKRRPATEPNPSLGFLLCPTADQKFELKKRLGQAQAIGAKVATATLNAADAWLGLVTRALPQITYPFGLTRFNKKQLKQISIAIDNAFFPKLGLNRKTPRVIATAPEEFGGLSYPSMETIQDQKGITLFLRQLQWNQEIAQDLRILISHAQPVPCLEEGIISHLRSRLKALQGKIAIDGIWTPSLQRLHDRSIMEVLCMLPKVSRRQLQVANFCRKWMRVITIAELASIDGRYLPPDRFNGRWRAKSKLKWPHQPPPTAAMWTTFRQLMKQAFCTKSKHYSTKIAVPLDTPLGPWLKNERHVQYKAYRTDQTIFILSDVVYERYIENEHANYFTLDAEKPTRNNIPPEAHPIETYISNEKLYSHHHYLHHHIEIEEENSDSTDENIEKVDEQLIYDAVSILAASDSSVDNFQGEASFNWRITTWTKKGLITRSAFAEGNPKYMNSYRGEMAGVHDLIKWLHSEGMTRKKIKIVCDNQSCVTTLNTTYFSLTDLDQAEADLIRSIRKLIIDFEDLTIAWVRGHQDDEKPYSALSLEAQLNVDCDKAAKEFLQNNTKPPCTIKPLQGMHATLYLGGQPVTTEINKQIQFAAQSKLMLEYIADKFQWTDAQAATTVNWRALGLAKRRMRIYRSVRTTKMLYSWLNVGTQKGKMGEDSTCPCCGIETEDQLHMYQCQDERVTQNLDAAIASFQSKLVKDGLTTPTYTAIVNMVCQAAHRPPLSTYNIECEQTPSVKGK